MKTSVRLRPEWILDIGCGKGGLLAIIKRNIHSSDFIGVDISVNMLKGVRLKAIDHCIVADALHLPIRERAIDILISTEMIEHIIDPIKFLEESKRILRRNGFIILTFPNCLAYYLRLYLFLNFYPYG